MIKVKEIKIGTFSEFEVFDTISKEKRFIKPYLFVTNYNNAKYYIMYDSNSNILFKVTNYLNHHNDFLSPNFIKASAYALRYLYAFSEIIEKDIEMFDGNDFRILCSFLKGASAVGNQYSFTLLSKRKTRSVINMLGQYRKFFDDSNLKNANILNDKKYTKYIPRVPGISMNVKKSIPMYITEEQYINILNEIDKINNKMIKSRLRCIVRLGYECAMRLGEVLGLTLEDFESYVTKKGKTVFQIIIRNRLSDKEYQSAKTCTNVFDKKDYMDPDYTTYKLGYQIAGCSKSLMDEINDYIDTYHPILKKKYPKNYQKAMADAVGMYKNKNMKNYYIFLNKNGAPISNGGVNILLKKIFIKCGIEIDYNTKTNNLFHRFRHGFVTRMVLNDFPDRTIRVFTRHESEHGLDPYREFTPEDELEMKEEIEVIMGLYE